MGRGEDGWGEEKMDGERRRWMGRGEDGWGEEKMDGERRRWMGDGERRLMGRGGGI